MWCKYDWINTKRQWRNNDIDSKPAWAVLELHEGPQSSAPVKGKVNLQFERRGQEIDVVWELSWLVEWNYASVGQRDRRTQYAYIQAQPVEHRSEGVESYRIYSD